MPFSLAPIYVDDTLVIWPHSRRYLDHFLVHINQHHPSIKFTMETEQNNSIPFLDVLITKSPSGKPAHQVYRKPTHSDRYLHYRSFHHPSVQQSVPNALIRRAHQLSDADHLDQEIQHVTTALTTIDKYPRHKIKSKTPASKPAAITIPEENQPAATPPKQTVVLPYIGQASHKIQCILQTADIQVRHSYSHKDKHPNHKKAGVHKTPCECGKVYIGETGRNLETRLKEHRTSFRLSDWDKSAIVKHAQQHEHTIEWDNSHFISIMKHWHTHGIREAIEIHCHNTVPQDSGLYINDIWKPLINKYPVTLPPPPPPPPPSPPRPTAPQLQCTADDSRLQRRLRRGHTQRLADSTPHSWIPNSPKSATRRLQPRRTSRRTSRPPMSTPR
eukprot:XP_011667801.1 PREDICTED: uncharacterized protein LOC105439928 [Strongylocentrotus purpuratus]